jgi:hypothetical protein
MLTPIHLLRVLLARIAPREPGRAADPPLRDGGVVLAAMMTDCVRQRELQGLSTSLRQLHRLLDVSQPAALRIAHLLSREGVLCIEEDLSDRLESTVRLSVETRKRYACLAYENLAEEVA